MATSSVLEKSIRNWVESRIKLKGFLDIHGMDNDTDHKEFAKIRKHLYAHEWSILCNLGSSREWDDLVGRHVPAEELEEIERLKLWSKEITVIPPESELGRRGFKLQTVVYVPFALWDTLIDKEDWGDEEIPETGVEAFVRRYIKNVQNCLGQDIDQEKEWFEKDMDAYVACAMMASLDGLKKHPFDPEIKEWAFNRWVELYDFKDTNALKVGACPMIIAVSDYADFSAIRHAINRRLQRFEQDWGHAGFKLGFVVNRHQLDEAANLLGWYVWSEYIGIAPLSPGAVRRQVNIDILRYVDGQAYQLKAYFLELDKDEQLVVSGNHQLDIRGQDMETILAPWIHQSNSDLEWCVKNTKTNEFPPGWELLMLPIQPE